MALNRVQLVRHTLASAAIFEGLEGEVTVNLSNNSLHVHDGSTPGGFELARKDLTNVNVASVLFAGKMSVAHVIQLNEATAGVASDGAAIISNSNAIAALSVTSASHTSSIAANAIEIANINVSIASMSISLGDLTTLTNLKADKVIGGTTGNVTILAADGNYIDSGESPADFHDATKLTGSIPGLSLTPATELSPGVAEIATQAEVLTRTDSTRFITPNKLPAVFNSPGSIGAVLAASGTFTTLRSRGLQDEAAPSLGRAAYIAGNGFIQIGGGTSPQHILHIERPTGQVSQQIRSLDSSDVILILRNLTRLWQMRVTSTGGFRIENQGNSSLAFISSGALDVANSNVVLDENDLISNSNVRLPTQRSVKTFTENLIDSHSHSGAGETQVPQAGLEDNSVGVAQIKKVGATVSVTGVVPTATPITITMQPMSFFPMVRTTNNTSVRMTPALVSAGADSPRFGLISTDFAVGYTVNYRYIPA